MNLFLYSKFYLAKLTSKLNFNSFPYGFSPYSAHKHLSKRISEGVLKTDDEINTRNAGTNANEKASNNNVDISSTNQAFPGSIPPDNPGPTDILSVQQMNEVYASQRQALHDRLEADGKGYDTVFAQ